MQTVRKEQAHSINGVAGRLHALHVPPAPWVAGVFANQTWTSEARKIDGYGAGAEMTVEMRFDDNCKNKHMSFAITAHVVTPASRHRNDWEASGCMHEEIAQVFPELKPLIKWHLVSTDSPMHYVANTLYHASDRDYNGRVKGEPCAWDYGYRFDNVPMVTTVSKKLHDWIEARRAFNSSTLKSNPAHGDFQVVAIAHVNRPGDTYKFKPKFTFVGFGQTWYDCPFDDEETAQSFAASLNKCNVHPVKIVTDRAEGKARDFDAARNCGVWPDATDEELSAPKEVLKAALQARLPALIAAFRNDMERIGFLWEAPARV